MYKPFKKFPSYVQNNKYSPPVSSSAFGWHNAADNVNYDFISKFYD